MRIAFVVGSIGVSVVALTLVTAALAQGGRQQLGNSFDIEKAWNGFKTNFQKQARGEEPPVPAHLEAAAKFYVYRMTWDEGSKPLQTLPDWVKDFNVRIDEIMAVKPQPEATKPPNEAFKAAFSQKLVEEFRELTPKLSLLDNSRAILHGAQMFPALGRMKHEHASVYFLELIDQNPKNLGQDAVRLWALRGLRELFPVTPWGGDTPGLFDPKSPANIKKRDNDVERVVKLTLFIHRPAPTPPDPDTLGAYLYLRREAIEALASAGYPAVNCLKSDAKVEGPIATTLLKVLVPGNLSPAPTLAERNEAALGLCNMKGSANCDAKLALSFIAQTLVDLNREYAEDYGDPKRSPRMAWKYQGARWKRALENLLDKDGGGPFVKDDKGLGLAKALVGDTKKGEPQFAFHTVSQWYARGTAINNLKLEGFAKANLPPLGPLSPFNKGMEGGTVNWEGPKTQTAASEP